MKTYDLSGKTALITGASRGIGEAVARAFAAQGAKVMLTARSASAIEAIAEDIRPAAQSLPVDVAKYDEVDRAVCATIDAFGAIDILINNAGAIEPISRMDEADPAAWGQVIDINLKGVFHGMRAVLPSMLARGSGTILTISSGAAHNPLEGWSHYCASKAAVHMLTRCVHREHGASGIRAMGLSPGTVATQMQREIKASGVNPVSQLAWSDHIPPEWPAVALSWMCTEAADAHLGEEISLRAPEIRAALGLAA